MKFPAPVNVLGVHTHPVDVDILHDRIADLVSTNAHGLVLHVNVYGLNLAYSRPWLTEFFNSAEVVFCDGAGVILGARILGQRIPRRITYADWMWELAEFASVRGISMFFLGASPGVADEAASRLRTRYPQLRILGTQHGYFDKRPGSAENRLVVDHINEVAPDILIVGFGMPLQERWLLENWADVDAGVALTGGGVFDYVSGRLRRAPRWMTDHGLEWLGRLGIEPRRLWSRYLGGNPLFLWRVVRQRRAQGSVNGERPKGPPR